MNAGSQPPSGEAGSPEPPVAESAASGTEEGSGWVRRLGFGALALVVVAGVAVAAFLFLLSRVSTRSVTVDEAREQVEEAGGLGVDDGATVAFRPEAGIYSYLGEGTETLDKPPTSQEQGPEIPGVVTHLEDGCWSLRVDYNLNHWQSWEYCPTAEGLNEIRGEFFQRLDLVVAEVETASDYECAQPAPALRRLAEVGDQWMHECSGTSSGTEGEVISAGPYSFEGVDTLDIGGEPVEALHYRRLRNLSGGQAGVEDTELWFHPDSGLPLGNSRRIEVRSDSLIGGVTYSEEGSFELTSLLPQ